MVDHLYDFGDTVRNQMTNVTGIVNAKMEFMTGCKQYNVIYEDDSEWYDEGVLELVEKATLARKAKTVTRYDIVDNTEKKEIGFK